MAWNMEENGTISHWITDAGQNILFPESLIDVNGSEKKRGGAPVCCPNFGTAITDGLYEGIELPKHGLVRTSKSSPRVDKKGFWTSACFSFAKPWGHEVTIEARVEKLGPYAQQLEHVITLQAKDTTMPYSIGFHPYFATEGKPFELIHGQQRWKSHELAVDKPLMVHCYDTYDPFVIAMENGTAIISFADDQGYSGFCVWTDNPDQYICVEPTAGHRSTTLEAGKHVNCMCRIIYVPIRNSCQ